MNEIETRKDALADFSLYIDSIAEKTPLGDEMPVHIGTSTYNTMKFFQRMLDDYIGDYEKHIKLELQTEEMRVK